jgi:hypothetical protein
MSRSQVDFITWAIGLAVGGATTVVFLFTTFQTKAEASADSQREARAMERIEDKVDALLLKQGINPLKVTEGERE